jgi:hypothetical protein
MRKRTTYWLLIALIGALTGCSLTGREMRTYAQSERMDVFYEVEQAGPVPAGFFALVIRASIKTHVEGYYSHEPSYSFHSEEWLQNEIDDPGDWEPVLLQRTHERRWTSVPQSKDIG